WAIALLVQRQVRMRGEVGLAVFREDSRAFREHLADWTLIADYGHVKSEWDPGEPIPPAVTTAYGTSPDGDRATIRIFDTTHGLWFPSASRALTLPVSRFRFHTPDSIPYMVPEAALLGLAPNAGPDQHADMWAALPFLDGQGKLWLDRALAMTIPAHDWRSVLTPPRPPAPPQEDSEE
ncbi:MAG: hypothetical protein ABFS86_03110, partial [Planctomycetota bacterium]